MRVMEYGKENEKTVCLIHPSMVRWDYFEDVIPLMEENFHLIIPVLPGFDEKSGSDFTSVEDIASKLADWLNEKELDLSLIYGCSMGGSVVVRMLADGRVRIDNAVIDGGITPYQLPWIITRFIAVRDWAYIMMGKIGGYRMLEKAFSATPLSEEDIKYMADVMGKTSSKSIWRCFESANNYDMPESVDSDSVNIEYWFADMEEKDRNWDIRYIHRMFPSARFLRFRNVGHGGLAPYHPQRLVKQFYRILNFEKQH